MEPKNCLNEGVSYKIYEKEMHFPVKNLSSILSLIENTFCGKHFSLGKWLFSILHV